MIRVPFPYTDREARQHRPALVVSQGGLGEDESLLWVIMITSAANRGWPGDVSLADSFAAAGLPIPSVIRTTKIAIIEARHAQRIGRLPARLRDEVTALLRHHLGMDRGG